MARHRVRGLPGGRHWWTLPGVTSPRQAVAGAVAAVVLGGGIWLASTRGQGATVALPARLDGYAAASGGQGRLAGRGGPASSVRRYLDGGRPAFELRAVRAATAAPVAPAQDLMALQVMRPPRQVIRIGEVVCVIDNDPIGKGSVPPPTSVHTRLCRRSDATLTVQVDDVAVTLEHHPRAVARLVDHAWARLR